MYCIYELYNDGKKLFVTSFDDYFDAEVWCHIHEYDKPISCIYVIE